MMKTANKSFGAFLRSVICVTLLVAICLSTEASAKRGCSAFGHSCFGGHGKRSEPTNRVEETLQEDVDNLNQEIQDYDTQRGGEEVLIADAGQIYQDRPMPRSHRLQVLSAQQQRPTHNLSPYIRQWLASYRRANSVDFGTK